VHWERSLVFPFEIHPYLFFVQPCMVTISSAPTLAAEGLLHGDLRTH
jgi:hypothetical protein